MFGKEKETNELREAKKIALCLTMDLGAIYGQLCIIREMTQCHVTNVMVGELCREIESLLPDKLLKDTHEGLNKAREAVGLATQEAMGRNVLVEIRKEAEAARKLQKEKAN